MTIVALDANVWLKERLLRSGMGAALLWAIKNTDSVLLLSDVTQCEIMNGVVKEIQEAAEEIEAGLSTIRAFIGKSQEVTIPSPEEVYKSVNGRLVDIGTILKVDNHKSEHLESALQRVLNHLPPAHKKEEFRDCMIWEMCLDIARRTREDLILITADAAFYHKDKFENGMAYPLREDLKRFEANIQLYHNIGAYLETIQEKIPKPDVKLVTSAIDEQVINTVKASVQDSSYSEIEICDSKIDVFLTEAFEILAISFKLKYKISDLELKEGIVLSEAYGIAEGSATLNTKSNIIKNLQMTAYRIESADGQILRQSGYVYGSGGIVGTRYIPYTLRRAI
ncbi:DUF4935 domain-containing protein [Oryzomonas sagensis]|uniref:DUF4935 domain-containing protein n=1 Tax=Oryzomonas sagensis TaxID=2603857 RepID=A0ABQ6TSJ5_9BACT|nr:PIN domain-containing protein [Oryzomonas sagensis]KAB0671978.1 DUF4935 domain-containing protein [Oryzomonas sagensis]